MQQYFIHKQIEENGWLALDEGQLRHIRTVMRMKDGERVRIADGSGRVCLGQVVTDGKAVGVQFVSWLDTPMPRPRIVLIQALIKKDKWDWVLQKAAELGVDEIYPLVAKRSVVKAEQEKRERKVERWNTITREACEQSLRSTICTVHAPITLAQAIACLQDINIICYEKETPKHHLVHAIRPDRSICMLIGPEGGFDEAEVRQAKEMGFLSCSLGQRILRAETASMYALSLIDGIREGMDV